MAVTVYSRGQMVIPAQARKQARIGHGDRLDVQMPGDGRNLLVRLERPQDMPLPKVRIIKRKGRHPVGDIGRPITEEEIKAALAEFR